MAPGALGPDSPSKNEAKKRKKESRKRTKSEQKEGRGAQQNRGPENDKKERKKSATEDRHITHPDVLRRQQIKKTIKTLMMNNKTIQ